jgi:hypothetical protein
MVSLPPPNVRVENFDDIPEDQRERLEATNKIAAYFVDRAGEALWEAFVREFPTKYPGMKLNVYDPAIKAVFLTALRTGFFNSMVARIDIVSKKLDQ